MMKLDVDNEKKMKYMCFEGWNHKRCSFVEPKQNTIGYNKPVDIEELDKKSLFLPKKKTQKSNPIDDDDINLLLQPKTWLNNFIMERSGFFL